VSETLADREFHRHVFVWVCGDNNRLRCRCACGELALVSVTAARVGHLHTRTSPTSTTCWRCGVTFDRAKQNVIEGAPCSDCRQTLRREGDTTIWDRRALKAKP